VGYNRRKFVKYPEIIPFSTPQWEKSSSVVSHNRGKSSPFYDTMEDNIFRCIPQRMKTSSIVSHNDKKPKNLN
jgi:hypothetical protein